VRLRQRDLLLIIEYEHLIKVDEMNEWMNWTAVSKKKSVAKRLIKSFWQKMQTWQAKYTDY